MLALARLEMAAGDGARRLACLQERSLGKFACVLIGSLNAVAPLISMFFMMTYGLVNVACGALEYSKSPGWRPTFQRFSVLSCACGAVLCCVAMFLTSVAWAVISFMIGAFLFLRIELKQKRGELQVAWGTALDARAKMDAMTGVMNLRTVAGHAKTFRPTFLVLGGDPLEGGGIGAGGSPSPRKTRCGAPGGSFR